jgi:hypothetical protein
MVATIRNYASFSAIDATPDTFNLDAGVYGVTLEAAVWGTATLQRVFPAVGAIPAFNVTVLTAFAADGYAVIQLPAGRYQLTLAGVTDLSGAIELIAHGSG